MDSLLNLAGNITALHQVTAAEWAGPCPTCGGRDRFRLWPARGRYWCRGCDAKGDMIQFARDFLGMSFRDAAELAGKVLDVATARTAAPAPRLRPAEPVDSRWQDAMEHTAWECFFRLQSDDGRAARDYLHGRGLSPRTIQDAGLGWNPQGHKVAGHWWLAAGITIPVRVDQDMHQLNVRRLNGEPKYQMAAGSRLALWGADTIRSDRPAVLVESVLDALSLVQAAGDLCTPLATGSTTGARRLEWVLSVAIAPALLVAFDADPAGDKAADWWLELPNARRLRPPAGQDCNDLLRAGELRHWFESAHE